MCTYIFVALFGKSGYSGRAVGSWQYKGRGQRQWAAGQRAAQVFEDEVLDHEQHSMPNDHLICNHFSRKV